MNRGIAYGGDYNPEQWPEDRVDEDITFMKTAGVNLVTVGVFSWAALQPQPDVFDFAWLDTVMDKLHAGGIQVDLATATASPPPWLGHLYPDTLPVTADGVQLTYGSRQQYNPSSARFRTEAVKMARAMAERYAGHPALAMWHVSNEYGCHVCESFDDESAAAFREWLSKRYGTLGELNRVWGTMFWSQRFSTWEEVIPPRSTPTMPNPQAMSDWRRFCSNALLECYRAERAVLTEFTPNIPVTTNFMGAFPWVDYWAWAKEIDIISNDSYPDPSDARAARAFAFHSDLMRSLGGGKPFIQLEQAPSAVQWRERNAAKRPGQMRLWSLQTVARGADGICHFQWRQSIAGAETFHSGMVPHAGTDSRVWHEIAGLGADLAKLDAVKGTRVDAPVAIVWDWQSAWAMRSNIGPVDTDPLTIVKSWHASLFEAGIMADFIHPDSDLSGYRVVIVPSLYQAGESFAERLRVAAEGGATILVTCHSGIVNNDGHAHLGGYLGPLSPLTGVRVLDVSPLAVTPGEAGDGALLLDPVELDPANERISSHVLTPAVRKSIPLTSTSQVPIGGCGIGWSEQLDVGDAQILAEFDGDDETGWAAVTRRAVGNGAVWYVATDPNLQARADILAAITQETSVEPTLALTPPGVEAFRRGPALFLLNHSNEHVSVPGVSGTALIGADPENGTVSLAPLGVSVLSAE